MPKDFKVVVVSVKSPRWANAEHTAIDCIVETEHMRGAHPFTASPYDVEPHGIAIFNRCKAGEFGDVAEYVPRHKNEQADSGDFELPDAWPDIHAFLRDANDENANGTERGCVLVWTSMIDELLRRLLEVFFVADSARSVDFFRHNGPAGSFSGRAKLAYFSGLIAEDELRVIDKLRDIRNDFAHQYGNTLADPDYAGRCEYLYKTLCGDAVSFPPRLQFTSACARVVMILVQRYAAAKAERRTAPKDLLPLNER